MLVRAKKPRKRGSQRDEQREETKRALLESAKRLFPQNGYDGVSVSDIAKEAGVSTSLINAHFGGKGGLLYAIVSENNEPQLELARHAARRRRSAMGKLESVFLTYAKADLSDPALLAAMQAFSWTWESDFESDNVLQRRIHEELLAEIIRDGMGKGEFRKLDLQRTVTSLWAIYTWGLRSGVFDGTSPEQCAKAINDQARDLLCEQG